MKKILPFIMIVAIALSMFNGIMVHALYPYSEEYHFEDYRNASENPEELYGLDETTVISPEDIQFYEIIEVENPFRQDFLQEYEIIAEVWLDEYALAQDVLRADETITKTITNEAAFELKALANAEIATGISRSDFVESESFIDEIVSETQTNDNYSEQAAPQFAQSLFISPTTNWTGIGWAGGAARIVAVTTNLPTYTVHMPAWINIEWLSFNQFRLTAQANPTASLRTGSINVVAGGIIRGFNVSQLPAPAHLNISSTANWIALSSVGGATRTVNVVTNLPTYNVYRPAWLNLEWLSFNQFRLTAQANPTTSARTGTVTVTGGGITRSFAVSQLAASPQLTISPTTNWTGIGSGVGATRLINVATNLPTYTVNIPGWLNLEWLSFNQFRLTAQANPTTSARTGTVTVSGGGILRSFSVSQSAAPAHLIISPTTNWTGIGSAGGATRTINVTTNLPTYSVYRPGWINIEWLSFNQFRLTAQANPNASSRTGTVTVTGGGMTRSFTVSQVAAPAQLTISPSTHWTGVGAAGGATRTVTVTTNLPTYNASWPGWLNLEWLSFNQFRLTAQANPNASSRTGTVTVTGEGITRSFNVTQTESTNVVTIVYSGNGHTSGTVPASQTLNTPGAINLRPQGNLARSGHTFVGWTNDGVLRQAGSQVEFTTATRGTWILDAYWTRASFHPMRHLTWWWPRSPGTVQIPLASSYVFGANVAQQGLWNQAMENARRDWNQSNIPIQFNRVTGGNSVRVIYSTDLDSLGYLRPLSITNTNLNAFYIFLNARTILTMQTSTMLNLAMLYRA